MPIYEHLTEFAGLPVHRFGPDPTPAPGDPLPEPGSVAWHVGSQFDGAAIGEVIEGFLEAVDTTKVTALLIGYWGMPAYDKKAPGPVSVLVDHVERFPHLRALFLGEIVMEEAEISWIEHDDITPLLAAYPRLEHLSVRGGINLSVRPFRSEHLRVLRFEAGGLPAGVVRSVGASDLPNLEHLELWLGHSEYGGTTKVDDLAEILSGERLPALRHLGLQNAEIQDAVAAAVARAPIVSRLESLDLSMGMLTDEGAEALLAGRSLTHLRRLNLHHHYLSDEMMARVRAALPNADLDDRQEDDDEFPFVAVGE